MTYLLIIGGIGVHEILPSYKVYLKLKKSWVWEHTPVIPALERLR
jgi:hypothetical protein